MKKKERAEVLSQEEISPGIFSLWLKADFAGEIRAGQFVSVFSKDRAHLLPRPISVCETDPEKSALRLVYRAVGFGTTEFSALKAGDHVEIMGPLGNGFPLNQAAGRRLFLMGGGIGIPPMLACAKAITSLPKNERPAEVYAVCGYRSAETYLLKDLQALVPVLIATDDGSLGTRGTVLDALKTFEKKQAGENGNKEKTERDVIFACGPKPMLRAIKDYAVAEKAQCYLSMEEKMACGVGVCLGCVTKTTDINDHSKVRNARVCKDGPVFDAREVDLT